MTKLKANESAERTANGDELMLSGSGPQAARNTDREVWRGPDQGNGDYYADSVHITEGGGIGIDVAGHVIVKPAREWHRLATPAPSVCREALEEAKLFLESVMLGYQRTRNYAQAAEWQSVIDKVDAALSAGQSSGEAEPVAWRHKHWPNEPWQYRESKTCGTPYPYYEPLYAAQVASCSEPITIEQQPDLVARLRTKHVYGTFEIEQQRQEAADEIERLRLAITQAEIMAIGDTAVWFKEKGYNPDAVLPCDVHLPPATVIRKGCKLSTLLAAFKVRETGWPEITPEQLAAIDKLVKPEFERGNWETVESEEDFHSSEDSSQAHKVMTLEEYLAEPRLKGWHSVCFDYDGFGGVGVRYHGASRPAGASRLETVGRGEQALNIVRQMVGAYDSGNLKMSSPEIGEPENDIPYHPWHEQLLHYARLALEPSTVTRPGSKTP